MRQTEMDKEEMELEGKKQITLERCLQDFKEPQTLDEDNKWYCWNCKTHVQATKVMQIYRAPPCLIISLKRFKTSKKKTSIYSSNYACSEITGKKDTLVEFPVESLDLSEHVLHYQNEKGETPQEGPLIYDLCAVSNHFGNLGFGHYTAFAKNRDTWLNFDDASVKPVTDPRALISSSAYNLFYRRRDLDSKGTLQEAKMQLEALKQRCRLNPEEMEREDEKKSFM